MKNLDFRTVPPKKRYNNYLKDYEYIIPCRVLKIGEEIDKKSLEISIEILDFANPEIVTVSGITYKKSLGYFPEPPFITECTIRKTAKSKFKLIVYNKSSPGLVEKLMGVREILNTNEEIIAFYNHNYTELRDWLMEADRTQNNTDVDLPF